MKVLGKIIIVLLLLLALAGCILYRLRTEEKKMGFYYSLLESDIVAIEKYLKSGMNPDFLHRRLYWDDRNPLGFVVMNNGVSDVDIDIMKLLINYGANVNLRPYIWQTLDHKIITEEDIQMQTKGWSISSVTEDFMYKKIDLLIQAGADVDKKGAPNRQLIPSTEKNYQKYFEREGSRPINYAIERNLPAIVNLLLRYTKLDEDSLIAARESNNPAMIEKITMLWEIQQE